MMGKNVNKNKGKTWTPKDKKLYEEFCFYFKRRR